MHEKIIVVDQVKALIGSQNASSTSLNKNRELSIQITAAPIVSAIEKTFDGDFTAAPAWKKTSS